MNKNIIDYLNKEINENKLSHAFLVETNSCEKLLNDISNIFYSNNLIPNQDIDNNIAISIIKPENNLIDKNKILDLQKFIMTKSVINKIKIYFILNAELMNLSSFNKLLKVLEEPAENVIGFLFTTDENQIISTIKSRCKRFKYKYDIPENIINEELINKFNNIRNLNYLEIIELKNELLKIEKNDLMNILDAYKNNLISTNGLQNISLLANQYKILDNIIELIKSNVNLELCLDKMFIEMRK